MTIHPSLSSKGKGKGVRSVLKRYEKFKELKEKEKWAIDDSIFELPKVKTMRRKLKKVKKAAEGEAAEKSGQQVTAEPAAKKEDTAKKK